MASGRFQILSLDGGGLKGLFTASFLARWEADTGMRIVDQFDLITGTSTGGIIALGLGLGFTAADLVKFYVEEAANIFPPKAFANLKHWFDVKYSAEGLEVALNKYFGERKLGESCRPLIIPSFYAARSEIYLFKTPHHSRLRSDWREKVVDVARATAAAPTYLDPLIRESGMQLIDGGVWANNPVMIGIAEALGYLAKPQHSVAALRVGTTSPVVSIDEYPDEGGVLKMARGVTNYMMRGQEKSASAMASHILGDRYHEVNPVVAPKDFVLDKFSDQLRGMADYEYRFHSSDLADKGFLHHQAGLYTPYYKEEGK